MATEQSRPRIPTFPFRVLIIGRENAGKKIILRRVCDATESPTVYRRRRSGGREEVRHGGLTLLPVTSYATQVEQVKLDPCTEVSDKRSCMLSPLNPPSGWRTRNRRRTCVPQPYGLYFSRFVCYRARVSRDSRKFAEIHPKQG